MFGIGHGVHAFIHLASHFLGASSLTGSLRPMPTGLEYASVSELGRQMSKPGGLTSVDLVKYFQDRINRQNPNLNAVIELNPQAVEDARKLDQERAEGKVRGPLHGIPILIKDTIETEGMQTSAGAFGLVGDPAGKNAPLVQRLIEQGAVIIGKTNLTELGGFRGGPDGWSSRGGQTRNPLNPSWDVGGSSSGSASAVAAGLAPLAVGAETSGSIVVPAAFNGVVGLKPSVGLLDRNGIIPASHHQDTPGPMARSVFDVALMLNAMSGRDPKDPASVGAPEGIDYTKALVPGALMGKRIGYPANFIVEGLLGSVVNSEQFTKTLEVLREQGAILVPVSMRLGDASRYEELVLSDVKQELNTYLSQRNGLPVKSLTELIKFNDERDGTETDHQPTLHEVSGSTLTPEEREEAWTTLVTDFRATVDKPINEENLDAMVADFETNSYFGVAAAGYPGITVPSGTDEEGKPTSAYFFGTRWSEEKLLAVAYGYEQAAAQAGSKPGR
ncbi:amidase family protein [Pseudomonas sp. SDO5271_S396]